VLDSVKLGDDVCDRVEAWLGDSDPDELGVARFEGDPDEEVDGEADCDRDCVCDALADSDCEGVA
jgi:hypothetical protein